MKRRFTCVAALFILVALGCIGRVNGVNGSAQLSTAATEPPCPALGNSTPSTGFTGNFVADERPVALEFLSLTQVGGDVSGYLTNVVPNGEGGTISSTVPVKGAANDTAATFVIGDASSGTHYTVTVQRQGCTLQATGAEAEGQLKTTTFVSTAPAIFNEMVTSWRQQIIANATIVALESTNSSLATQVVADHATRAAMATEVAAVRSTSSALTTERGAVESTATALAKQEIAIQATGAALATQIAANQSARSAPIATTGQRSLDPNGAEVTISVDESGVRDGDSRALSNALQQLQSKLKPFTAPCRVGMVLTYGAGDVGPGNELAAAINDVLKKNFPDLIGQNKTVFRHFSDSSLDSGTVKIDFYFYEGCPALSTATVVPPTR